MQGIGLSLLTRISDPSTHALDLASLTILYVGSQVIPPFDSPIATGIIVGGGTFYLTNLPRPLLIGGGAAAIIWASNIMRSMKAASDETTK